MRSPARAVFFGCLLVPGTASAQAAIVTTDVLTGYIIPESDVEVTNRPVVQTDIFIPTPSGVFAGIFNSHQLYEPTKPFSAPGDEFDLTGGWLGAIGPWLLRAQSAWWDIAGSHNNYGDAKATLARNLGGWAPFIGVEDQYVIPRQRHFAYVHGGTEVGFRLFSLPFQERFAVSWEDTGRYTFANVIYTAVTAGGVVIRPILRMSTDDRNHGPYASFGLRFVL